MSKEYLEAWNFIKGQMQNFTFSHLVAEMIKNADIVEHSLQRLEQIDNTNPNKAMDSLEYICKILNKKRIDIKWLFKNDYNTIQRTIIKTQELEKENAYIEKIKTMMKQKDCVLRYIESEDCFAVKTILSDGWYKLTPEFVENNVREEIKPLPLIEKNKQLKAENAEYKEVLEIIKEKRVNVANLIDWFNNSQNTSYEGYLSDYYQEGWFIHFKDNDDVDIMYQLTQKEFDTLKRWSKCQR